MAAFFVLMEKVIKPILAGVAAPRTRRKTKNQCTIDTHYQVITEQIHALLQVIRIAA
jgi:hypothetical protein